MDATAYASQSLSPGGTYVRSDFFATMVLADAHAVAGEAEQACKVAGRALDLGQSLKSARCRSYLREFRGRLIAAGGITAAVRLEEEYREHHLWPQAS